MTALERALVVYAEAKGYEIEVHIEDTLWNVKGTPGFFNFATCDYRIKNREDYRKTYDELSDFFKPLYTPEKKRTWNIEDLKKAPRQGFSCKTKMYTSEEIEEMKAEINVRVSSPDKEGLYRIILKVGNADFVVTKCATLDMARDIKKQIIEKITEKENGRPVRQD